MSLFMEKPGRISDQLSSNISGYLRKNAAIFPDKPALLHPVRISYRELESEVDKYSFCLEKAGIKSGTKTILLVPAGPEMLFITFALFRISAIPVMIDPGMGIRAMLKALEGVNADAFIGIPKAHLLRKIRPSVFKNVKIWLIPGGCWFPNVQKISKFSDDERKNYPVLEGDPCRMAAIFFTSGSTGTAKGVVYTAGMFNHQINTTKEHFNISSDATDLCTFPLLGLFAICHGNSSVMADMDMVHPAKIDPSRVVRNITDFGCTQMFGSPMILNRLSRYCNKKGIRLGTLRQVITAGAPVQFKIAEEFSQLIGNESGIHTPYGATEALPVTDVKFAELAMLSDRPVNENGICIGYPVKGLDVRIIKITDDPIAEWESSLLLATGQVGEIAVKGPWVSTEYFNNPDANRIAKIPDPEDNCIWHRMGDVGKADENGRIWFYGRKAQRVLTRKGTLFTIPCEAVFNTHPLVSRSALVGVTARDGNYKLPVICIQLEPGNHPSKGLKEELLKMGRTYRLTEDISEILFFKSFPVDPRHNAKIFREKLALKAEKRIK
jgi:acyl-coenzyme A synthetase/AMP-(fatty) acid ligase